MSWWSRYKAGTAVLEALVAISLVGVAAVAIGVAEAAGTAQLAAASVTDASVSGPRPTSAVTYQVSERRSAGHWPTGRRSGCGQRQRSPRGAGTRRGCPRRRGCRRSRCGARRFRRSPRPRESPGRSPSPDRRPPERCSTRRAVEPLLHCVRGGLDGRRHGPSAAHCVCWKSFATNMSTCPDDYDGKQPYGAWPVAKITVASGWQSRATPTSTSGSSRSPRSAGSGSRRGPAASPSGSPAGTARRSRSSGYNDTDAEPVRCGTKSFRFRTGQMEFYCHGFWTGTSGGPWILGYNA